MLCSAKHLDGFEIAARDGDIGQVRQVYFDDERWVIRYLVVQTGGWLSGRNVLISPHAVEGINLEGERVVVSLDQRQVEQAPDIDTDKPVSRQQETAYYDYYGYPYYWSGAGLWGAAAFPLGYAPPMAAAAVPPSTAEMPTGSDEAARMREGRRQQGDPRLRSSAEVTGYHVAATDGSIGHIEDFLFDPRSWAIQQVVIDTRNWLPGRKVLVQPQAIERVDWARREVQVRLTRQAIKASPPYDPQQLAQSYAQAH